MLFKLIFFFGLTPNVSFVFLYKKLPVPKLSFMATQFLELLIAKIYGTKTNNCSIFSVQGPGLGTQKRLLGHRVAYSALIEIIMS